MNHGVFPNVTRAHTSSRNAQALIRRNGLPAPEIFCVSRAYQTRHGNGWLTNEKLPPDLYYNPLETNRPNEWQGALRHALLDLDMLRYALQCEENYSSGQVKHLLLTCMDQLKGPLRATLGPEILELPEPALLKSYLPAISGEVLCSYSDDGTKVGPAEKITLATD